MSIEIKLSYQEELRNLRKQLQEALPESSINIFDQDAENLEKDHEKILKLKAGDVAKDFTLTNALGNTVNLFNMLDKSRVVLVFYRGTWCPYCNLALSMYQKYLEDFNAHNATLVAVSGQTPDESLSFKEKNELAFEVLSDNGNMVANLYTTVFRNSETALNEMENLGFSFDSFYGNDSKEIPVPAVFIIEQNGDISFARSEGGDYRNRTDASEILESLKNISL